MRCPLYLRNLRSEKPSPSLARIACDLVPDAGEPVEFWYELEGDGVEPSVTFDPFVLPALLACMTSGEDLVVEGEVSARLLWPIENRLQWILTQQLPNLRQVAVKAKPVKRPPAKGTGAVTGVSLGIDSLMVMERYFHGPDLHEEQVRCLVFNNIVPPDHPAATSFYAKRRARVTEYAEANGLPLVFVNTNADQVIPCHFEDSHTLRNFSSALTLQGSFNLFYYAAGINADGMKIGPYGNIAYADAMILPLLSTEAMSGHSVGHDMGRVDKTFALAGNRDARTRLDVCVQPHRAGDAVNCSQCWKCMRTMVTLEMAGALQHFSQVFDLAAYERRKRRYLVVIHSSDETFDREVVDYAREHDYQFKLGDKEFALIRALASVRRAYWNMRLAVPPSVKAPFRWLRQAVS